MSGSAVPGEPASPAPGRRNAPGVIVDVSPDRYVDCLDALHAGFGTEVAAYGITAENTPSNPAFWGDSVIPALVARGFELFAVEAEGRIVGCGFAGPSRGHPGSWMLRHLAVLPEARHRGVGEALVAEAARRARAGDASVLRIGIVAENLRLSQWYRRLGFVTTEAGLQYPGLPFTVDHLELPLTDDRSL